MRCDDETLSDLCLKVRSVLTDDLRKNQYKGSPNLMTGHCYVASEALYHLLGRDGWTSCVMRVRGGTHWFLRRSDGAILDPTCDQFDFEVDHTQGKGSGFFDKATI